MTPTPHEVTELLVAWGAGDRAALERLVPLVQAELRRLAKSFLRRERAGHTLETTALIHEAYLRLIDADRVEWQSRTHFYGIAARLMRQILVETARARATQKRGGGAAQLPLDEAMAAGEARVEDVVAVDEALSALSEFDARKAQVVELRFFGGLTEAETAEALRVSPETVRRDWRLARSWLLHRLGGGAGDEP
jgi:RNA polymerase sigma-70 factor, ECF subfamily